MFNEYLLIAIMSHTGLDARKTAENKTNPNPDSPTRLPSRRKPWGILGVDGAGLKCVRERLEKTRVRYFSCCYDKSNLRKGHSFSSGINLTLGSPGKENSTTKLAYEAFS